ncbi:PA3496 family putative envelope integrity protein [Pseudomonas sp. NW5]|uniref:PA3496 family putative envelope integrity protein n=1 Tax=Pseudomonas sp. NW5 TaxID=2934934 RepID=UPI0020201C78|nr:hypothetical protein [Pseudomonas sp. NW5]MCL7462099.1 hypothetical protein [Pseudomonas sp. NW5]
MTQAKTDLDLEEDFIADEQDDGDTATDATPASKNNSLVKRRVIDNLLEERRLKKQLSEYDYDL